MGVPKVDPLSQLSLPPGFRFFPTDEELLVQYLCRKVAGYHFGLQIIGDIDLYKFDPWVLPSKAIFGEKEWYFFSPRDRKYPNGTRPNRVAGSGYWKATGTDKVITTEGRKVGIKKALVFYVGKAPKGTKTNWIMHEYRLLDSSRKTGSSKLDDWVLCRIYKKNSGSQKPVNGVVSSREQSNGSSSSSSSHLDDMLESLPEMDDQFFSCPSSNPPKLIEENEKLNIQNLSLANLDWASLAGLCNSVPELSSLTQAQGIPNYNNDLYPSSIPPLCQVNSPPGKFVNFDDEEVQSGFKTQNSGGPFFQQNSNMIQQNHVGPLDPHGFRFPSHPSGFRFRQ